VAPPPALLHPRSPLTRAQAEHASDREPPTTLPLSRPTSAVAQELDNLEKELEFLSVRPPRPLYPNPYTLNPKPYTLNPEPCTLNPEP
jgi:hypothetical protein